MNSLVYLLFISPVLALIFNTSLHQGKASCHLIGKLLLSYQYIIKGSCTDPSNYRPISLTCICCKVFEHIISSAISQHADQYNIICKEQHSFRKINLAKLSY